MTTQEVEFEASKFGFHLERVEDDVQGCRIQVASWDRLPVAIVPDRTRSPRLDGRPPQRHQPQTRLNPDCRSAYWCADPGLSTSRKILPDPATPDSAPPQTRDTGRVLGRR